MAALSSVIPASVQDNQEPKDNTLDIKLNISRKGVLCAPDYSNFLDTLYI